MSGGEGVAGPDLPSARSLVDDVVRALEALGGQAERSAIKEKALELGNFTPGQRAEPTHAISKRESNPSELHYRLGWAISHAKNAGLIEQVERGWWRLTAR
jgi:restriction system protein